MVAAPTSRASLQWPDLEQRQLDAVATWKRDGLPTAIFRCWFAIHQDWQGMEAGPREQSLGYVAAAWANLNQACQGLELLPLLNEFVRDRFDGIAAKKPLDFRPAMASGEDRWHDGLHAVLDEITGKYSAPHEELLDALLRPYFALYHERAWPNARALVQSQLEELDRAAQCLQSSLLKLELVDWKAGSPEILEVLAVLAGGAADDGGGAAPLLSVGSDSTPLLRLFGFWSEHTPWFARFLGRHWPSLMPTASAPAALALDSLPSGRGCDLHVLLVGEGGSTREWLLACSDSPEAQLELVCMPESSLEASRATWQAGGPAMALTGLPEVLARRPASALCRLWAWELPAFCFRPEQMRATSPSGSLRDAEALQLGRAIIEDEAIGAAVALFEDPQLAPRSLTTWIEAIAVVVQHLQKHAAAAAGFTWCVNINRPAPPTAPELGQIDSQLYEEYVSCVRGSVSDGENSLRDPWSILRLQGNDADGFVQSALANPMCRRSPAFSARVVKDLETLRTSVPGLLRPGSERSRDAAHLPGKSDQSRISRPLSQLQRHFRE